MVKATFCPRMALEANGYKLDSDPSAQTQVTSMFFDGGVELNRATWP